MESKKELWRDYLELTNRCFSLGERIKELHDSLFEEWSKGKLPQLSNESASNFIRLNNELIEILEQRLDIWNRLLLSTN